MSKFTQGDPLFSEFKIMQMDDWFSKVQIYAHACWGGTIFVSHYHFVFDTFEFFEIFFQITFFGIFC